MSGSAIKIGYVPEHFSTPLFFALKQGLYKQKGLNVEFLPYPSGSGHLIQSLKDGTIDVSVGLTEAFVAGIGKGSDWYKIAGVYVKSPLCWAISSGSSRNDIKTVDDLQGKKIGISRIGSGSYVMPFVLAQQKDWSEPFDFKIHNDFKNLRDGVNQTGTVEPSDAFMWEIFTTKKYYDNGEVKQVGEIYTPWPSWVISASTKLLDSAHGKEQLADLFECINQGIAHFNIHHDEAIEYIAANLDYSAEDAAAWIKTVEFNPNVAQIDKDVVIDKTISILQKAGVLNETANEKSYVVDIESKH